VVVEFLTFQIEPSERDRWMAVEEETWSRFLERQQGFVSKQLWVERDRPGEIHAVIVWEDDASWAAIPEDELAAVDAAMGSWVREPTCRVFDILRNC
jgi:uncharacterized protein (TIGR03792 family)